MLYQLHRPSHSYQKLFFLHGNNFIKIVFPKIIRSIALELTNKHIFLCISTCSIDWYAPLHLLTNNFNTIAWKTSKITILAHISYIYSLYNVCHIWNRFHLTQNGKLYRMMYNTIYFNRWNGLKSFSKSLMHIASSSTELTSHKYGCIHYKLWKFIKSHIILSFQEKFILKWSIICSYL